MIFGTNMIQETWTLLQEVLEAVTRVEGAPPERATLPHGPPDAPPTYFFLLYKPTYPINIQGATEDIFPPLKPSVSARSHLGAVVGVLPEGESTMKGFYINTIALPMSCE